MSCLWSWWWWCRFGLRFYHCCIVGCCGGGGGCGCGGDIISYRIIPYHTMSYHFYTRSISQKTPRRVSSQDSQEGGDDHDDGDTSGVRLLLTSPDASDAKDREVWCAPEEILAMLMAGVKVCVYVFFVMPFILDAYNLFAHQPGLWAVRQEEEGSSTPHWSFVSLFFL